MVRDNRLMLLSSAFDNALAVEGSAVGFARVECRVTYKESSIFDINFGLPSTKCSTVRAACIAR